MGKVNTVCAAMCKALLKVDERRYVYTILTTDAKRSPPDLETAMKRILEIKGGFNWLFWGFGS